MVTIIINPLLNYSDKFIINKLWFIMKKLKDRNILADPN